MFNVGDSFTLKEEWVVEVPWYEKNLKLLHTYKLTGHKSYNVVRYTLSVDGKYQPIEVEKKYLVKNPLFKISDEQYNPVDLSFYTGTTFEIKKFTVLPRNKKIENVFLKCEKDGESKYKIKGISFVLPYDSFKTITGISHDR